MIKKLILLVVFFVIFSLNLFGAEEKNVLPKSGLTFTNKSNTLPSVESGEKIKIYEPKGARMLVPRESIIIIGERKDNNIKELKVKVNGRENKEELKDIFHLVIKLFPGKNEIKISNYSDIIFEAEVYYKKERDFSEEAKQYPKYIFHNEKTKEFCEKCHIIDANKGKKDICYIECHKNIIRQDIIKPHGPVGEGACLACHDPDGLASGYGPLIEGGKICYTCHENVVDGKYPHAAAKMEDCMGCHDPHGSPNSFFIKEPENKVCLRCHLNMYERSNIIYDSTGKKIIRTEVYNVKYQHPPVKEGYCLKCHDPHVSDHGRAHLRKRTSVLCKDRDCHAAVIQKFDGHFHVYDVNPAYGAPVKLPKDLRKDEYNNVVCYSCHDPHGSNNKGFLRKPYDLMCPWCHTNIPKRLDKSKTEE
ncbi:MAG: hypothetical protein HY934_08375 [Candidatus Firestonebacteria bacterium]|nr:hypothetical protein [Candidatus Firestonebacteria bacterium]